jgi:multidrug resistance efflux pump
MARAPAIVNLRDADLRSINEHVSRVRQRLEQIEAQPTVSPTELELLRRQLAALQARVQALLSAPATTVRIERDGRIARDQLRLPAVNIADGSLAADGSWDARGTRWIDEAT